MVWIEQQIDRDGVVHADIDTLDTAHLIVIGDGGRRAFRGIENFKRDLGLVRQ